MEEPALVKTLTLLRLIAFMVLLYLGLGWFTERYSTRPDSKVRGFFRLLCSPITRPVARLMPSGTGELRVLAVAIGLVAGIWVVLIVATEALRAR
jgi:uncharacterized protein YggT (Ycf19 family)